MERVHLKTILQILFIICAILTLPYGDVFAQRRAFLNEARPVDNDNGQPSGTTTKVMKIGETLYIDVWFNVGTENISAMAAYLTLDGNVFELIDMVPSTQTFRPFDFTFPSRTAFTRESANMVERESAALGTWFYGGATMDPGVTVTGQKRFARMAVRAIGTSPSTEITIDYEPQNNRISGVFYNDASFNSFNILDGMTIEVQGLNVEDIPDVLMVPGQTLTNHINLDSFLLSEPDDWSRISWNVTGTQSNVQVDINQNSHDVTFTSNEGYTGQQKFVFTVRHLDFALEDSDTMFVNVSYKPEIRDEVIPDPIRFNEDEIYTGAWLDTLVLDDDDAGSTHSWSAYSIHDSISIEVDSVNRTYTISGKPDYNGNGFIVLRVEDTKTLFDTLKVPVIIDAVNDPPILSGMPDVHILPGQTDSSVILRDYVIDVDHPKTAISYNWSGELNIRILQKTGTKLHISSVDGFEGSETVIFRAWDITPASASFDTITITVGPKPPRILGLPDTVIKSTNLPLSQDYVDLDNYVIDEDNTLESLTWQGAGEQLSVFINTETHLAQFSVPANMHDYENVTFTVSDPPGASASDTIRVFVLNNGRPLIWNLPDTLYLPAGGTISPYDLDTAVIDLESSVDQLSWSVSGNDKIDVSIDPTTHLVTISSPDPTYFDSENVVFTVIDPDNKTDTHTMFIQPITYGTPVVQGIPDITITAKLGKELNLDNFLFFFPDSERYHIRWTVSPENDPNIKVVLNEFSGKTSFTVNNEAFQGTRQFTFTATNTKNGNFDTDQMSVDVTTGITAIMCRLPDLTFATGDSSEIIELNKYVFDKDTHEDSLLFTVTANNIRAVSENLEKKANHLLILYAVEGFIGAENVIVTVYDPEGNSVSDTMRVSVTSSATLDIVVVPNPASADYIDIGVFASDSLIGSPAITLTLNELTHTVNTVRIPGALIWKGDYEFQQNETGTVMIRAIAADNFGSVIIDSLSFDILSLQKSRSLKFVDSRIVMEIEAGSEIEKEKIIIIPEEYDRMDRYFDVAGVTQDRLSRPHVSYYIGPEYSGFSKGSISFKLNDISEELKLDKLGVYFYDRSEGLLKFISNEIEYSEKLIRADINKFGRYVVASDEIAPVIISVERSDIPELGYVLEINEKGSGVHSIITRIGENLHNNRLFLNNENKLSIEIIDFEYKGQTEIFFTAVDNAGNRSDDYRLNFDQNNHIIPEKYELKDNFPNPFNPATTIEYRLPETERVVLDIYNIKGQLVRTLVNQTQNSGSHRVKWDGKDTFGNLVASGVYIYTIRTKNFTKAKKMVLLK